MYYVCIKENVHQFKRCTVAVTTLGCLDVVCTCAYFNITVDVFNH